MAKAKIARRRLKEILVPDDTVIDLDNMHTLLCCATCFHYENPPPIEGEDPPGECVKDPPVLMLLPAGLSYNEPYKMKKTGEEVEVTSRRPPTYWHSCCASHLLHENKAKDFIREFIVGSIDRQNPTLA